MRAFALASLLLWPLLAVAAIELSEPVGRAIINLRLDSIKP